MKFRILIFIFLTSSTIVCSQFYNHDIGFNHIGIDTSFNKLYFVYKSEGEQTLRQCEPYENFTYKEGSVIDCYGYAEEYDDKNVKIELEKPEHIDAAFNNLYNELAKDTFFIKTNQSTLLYVPAKNNYILSSYKNNKFDEIETNAVISFQKVLLDRATPMLISFCCEDRDLVLFAFYDKKHEFHLMDQEGFEATDIKNLNLVIDAKEINDAILYWHKQNDTTSFKSFNAQSLTFSKEVYGQTEKQISIDEFFNMSYENTTGEGEKHDTKFKISDIKKYGKNNLLSAVKGKVFNQGAIKFINESGGAIFINHNVEIEDSHLSFFKAIELIENVTILYDGEFTLLPLRDRFVLVNKKGEIFENMDIDFILGNKYKRRSVLRKEDLKFYCLNNKWGIKDKLNGNNLLQPIYDSLFIDNNALNTGLIVARKGSSFVVFNVFFEKIFISEKVDDFKLSNQFVQFIENDKMHYLTADGSILEKTPIIRRIVCSDGTFSNQRHKLELKIHGAYEFYFTEHFTDDFEYEPIDMSTITKRGSINISCDSIKFINGKTEFVDYFSEEKWQNYILSFNGAKIDLMKLEFIEKADKVNIVKEVTADEFIFLNDSQPLMYRIGNLWGYYKLNKGPKYKSISEFNGHYARIQNNKGRWGWINRYGKEFWD